MSVLFSPFTMRAVTLKNRLVMSPMCQYSAEDGFANDWHLVHLGSRAVGGAGLVIAEATAVSPEGRITPDDLGIWMDEHIVKLKQITSFIETQGAVPAIQLAHAGRKGSITSEWKGGGRCLTQGEDGWRTIAPSAIPFYRDCDMPLEMTREDILDLIAHFVTAARRALAAGFKIVEIHAAHGYLLHEFLSPLSNHREDEYGGSFDGRIRLLLEVTKAVRKVWPENLPLWVRISATDWHEGGWDIEQSEKLSAILKDKGVDVIDVSSGGLVPHAEIPVGYGYQLPFASRIKRNTAISVGAVGMITDAVQAETVLKNNMADLIVVGREFLRDPYFPLHAAACLRENIEWPVQYARAK